MLKRGVFWHLKSGRAAPETPEGDELDVLVTLVEAWEARHHPLPPADPVAAIRHVMAAQGYTQADLARLLNSRSRASEVLLGKRGLARQARAVESGDVAAAHGVEGVGGMPDCTEIGWRARGGVVDSDLN